MIIDADRSCCKGPDRLQLCDGSGFDINEDDYDERDDSKGRQHDTEHLFFALHKLLLPLFLLFRRLLLLATLELTHTARI